MPPAGLAYGSKKQQKPRSPGWTQLLLQIHELYCLLWATGMWFFRIGLRENPGQWGISLCASLNSWKIILDNRESGRVRSSYKQAAPEALSIRVLNSLTGQVLEARPDWLVLVNVDDWTRLTWVVRSGLDWSQTSLYKRSQCHASHNGT